MYKRPETTVTGKSVPHGSVEVQVLLRSLRVDGSGHDPRSRGGTPLVCVRDGRTFERRTSRYQS